MFNIEEKMEVCAICGSLVALETMSMLSDGRMVCESCYDWHTVRCEDCDDIIASDEAMEVYNRYGEEIIVCEACAEDYNYCPQCGRMVHDWLWFDDLGICTDCAEELYDDVIRGYHEGHPDGLNFLGYAEYSFIRGYFGAELEVSTNSPEYTALQMKERGCNTALYHLERDCSVEGFEIVFQPMTFEYMQQHLSELTHIFDTLQDLGCVADFGNGLHVHVSRIAFGHTPELQARRIALCMKAFAGDNYNRMVNASGRGGDARDWCRDNAAVGSFEQKIQASHTRRAERYLAVNVQNYNTVEFRLGRSTIDCTDFLRWLQTIAVIVRRSESITPAEATDLNNWFIDAPKDLVSWLNSRDAMIREPLRDIPKGRYNEIILTLARRCRRNVYDIAGSDISESDILRNIVGLTEQELRALGLEG